MCVLGGVGVGGVCLSLNDVKIRCERACESLALNHNGIVMSWM